MAKLPEYDRCRNRLQFHRGQNRSMSMRWLEEMGPEAEYHQCSFSAAGEEVAMENKKFVREEIAKALDGREYLKEITPEIREMLEEADLVVVLGASDDIMDFQGAINDQIGCSSGGKAYLDKDGLIVNACDEEYCPYFAIKKENATIIEALWCEEDDIAWTYKTDIPHSTFMIMEDGEKYCRGIVFSLADVAS